MSDEVKAEVVKTEVPVVVPTVETPEKEVPTPPVETPKAETPTTPTEVTVITPVAPVVEVVPPTIIAEVVKTESDQPKESFSKWIFHSLVERGIVRDYEAVPHVGKGRKPVGNLTLKVARIMELRASTNPNDVLWGLIGASLMGIDEEVGAGKKILNLYKQYADKYYVQDPAKFFEIMKKAAICAGTEWKAKYKAI